jgi:predicted metallo-beta-lactamase superfamily hydrolase
MDSMKLGVNFCVHVCFSDNSLEFVSDAQGIVQTKKKKKKKKTKVKTIF